jgi:hypothetical protein
MLRIFATTLVCLSALYAQSEDRIDRIEGYVADQTGARIAGASVSLRGESTNWKAATVSAADGTFRFLRPPSGKLELRVAQTGFQPPTQTIDLQANTSAIVVTLSAASVQQSVEVAEGSAMLQTRSSAQTTTISSRQIDSLPTASRNYTHLVVGEAGVSAPLPDRTGRGMNLATSPGSQGDDGTQSLNPSVNGARPTNNSLMINGVDATNMMNGGGSLGNNITVPLDALEAVEMQTALYSATTGRNGGASIQMITRTGTNQFHGAVSHFLQNEQFNANEFFLNRSGTARAAISPQRDLSRIGRSNP